MFWRSFEDIVYVYLPTMEYILATKIAAYRPKDADDIQLLIRDLNIRTREQVKAIADKFLLLSFLRNVFNTCSFLPCYCVRSPPCADQERDGGGQEP